MIMSQKLKSTRNDGGRGWGWKMTTTWDSESGLYRENEGEETGSSHERRRMPTTGSMVWRLWEKNSHHLTGLHRWQCPQESYRFSWDQEVKELLQKRGGRNSWFGWWWTVSCRGQRVSKGGKGEKRIYRVICRRENEGFPRCLGLLLMAGIKSDKVHKKLF